MQLYNTRTQKKEEFIPHEAGKVKMYTCGPTVYHYAHIGNLRSYIMEDMLEKALRYLGYDVTRAMNITDVGHLSSDADTGEDKMLKGARREHKTVMQIAQFYTDAFFSDCEKLGIKRPEIVVPAFNSSLKSCGVTSSSNHDSSAMVPLRLRTLSTISSFVSWLSVFLLFQFQNFLFFIGILLFFLC